MTENSALMSLKICPLTLDSTDLRCASSSSTSSIFVSVSFLIFSSSCLLRLPVIGLPFVIGYIQVKSCKEIKPYLEDWCSSFGAWNVSGNLVSYGWSNYDAKARKAYFKYKEAKEKRSNKMDALLAKKITEEKLEELGFVKVANSVKPTFYVHEYFPYHLIGFHTNIDGAYQWAVYVDNGDCPEMNLVISNLSDIIEYIARTSRESGKRIRSKEIKKLIDF